MRGRNMKREKKGGVTQIQALFGARRRAEAGVFWTELTRLLSGGDKKEQGVGWGERGGSRL